MTNFSIPDIDYYRERKCEDPDCYNMKARGYIYCPAHLGWETTRLPEDVIAILKQEAQKHD